MEPERPLPLSPRHRPLTNIPSQMNSIHTISTYYCKIFLIQGFHLCIPHNFFFSFRLRLHTHFSHPPSVLRDSPCHPCSFDQPNNVWWKVKIIMRFSANSPGFLPLNPNCIFSTLFSNTPICSLSLVGQNTFRTHKIMSLVKCKHNDCLYQLLTKILNDPVAGSLHRKLNCCNCSECT